jgi:hypothetical protein
MNDGYEAGGACNSTYYTDATENFSWGDCLPPDEVMTTWQWWYDTPTEFSATVACDVEVDSTGPDGIARSIPKVPDFACVSGGTPADSCPSGEGRCTTWVVKKWNGKKYMKYTYTEGADDPTVDKRYDTNAQIICGKDYTGRDLQRGWDGNEFPE